MSEQSDRIRAVLVRSAATRKPDESPADLDQKRPDQKRDAGATSPSIAISEENLAALLGSAGRSNAPAIREQKPAPEPEPAPEQTALKKAEPREVENTLPLIAASDENRVTHFSSPDKAEAGAGPVAAEAGGAETISPSRGENSAARQIRFRLTRVGAAIALAGLCAFWLRDHWLPAPKHTVSAPAASVPLRLELESQPNGQIDIRWNPQSTPVLQATEGRLVIMEIDQLPRIVTLQPDQLKIGHLYFQSSAERIEFRLELLGRSGVIAKESVLAVSAGATPGAHEAQVKTDGPPQAGSQQTPAAAPQGISNPDASADSPPVETAPDTASQSQRPIRVFTLPPPQQRSAEEGRVILPDSPVAALGGSVIPPDAGLPAGLQGLSVPRIPAPPVKEAPAAQEVKVGGKVQAPTLINKVAPVYPPLAKLARTQGMVRFNATIGADGTVQNLQLVSGPAVLVKAAADAVKQWVYRPTLLDGEPVKIITQIDVNFNLNQ
jgi:TonB family protein